MQSSPERLAQFSPDKYPEVTIFVRPATGPQRAKYIGEAQKDSCNIGELALAVCKKHVRDIDGVSFDFNHRNSNAFDQWEWEWLMETMTFISLGSTMSEDDAKNSD